MDEDPNARDGALIRAHADNQVSIRLYTYTHKHISIYPFIYLSVSLILTTFGLTHDIYPICMYVDIYMYI